MTNLSEELLEAVKGAAQDGRLSCSDAQALAEKFSVSYGTVGQAANELKIKIKGCQLGCF